MTADNFCKIGQQRTNSKHSLNGPAHEHEKTLAKHHVAKNSSHTSKKQNLELFPLCDSE